MANIGTFPSSPGFAAANFKQNNLTKRTQTASGRVVRSSNSTTLWSGTLAFPIMTQAEFRPIAAFVARAQGGLNDFDIVIPEVSKSTSTFNHSVATLTTTASASAGDTSVDFNCGTGPTNVFKAGDLVRFANHTKVYMIAADVSSDASGDATMTITPALVEGVSNTENITSHDVPFRMILSNDLQEFNYRTDGLVAYEIDVEEAI